MGFTTNDRFRVVEAPEKAPGCCGICKSPSRGPFVDTGVNDPWNGNVLYVCFGCLHDIVDNLESFTKVQVLRTTETNDEAYERARLDISNSVRNDLDAVLASLTPNPVDADPVVTDLHDPGLPGVPEDYDGEQGSTTGAPEATGQDDGPPKRKGRNGVSGDSGSEQLPEPVIGFTL